MYPSGGEAMMRAMSGVWFVLIALVAAVNLRLIADCLLAFLGYWERTPEQL
jgi:hypothetical protein